MSVEKKIFGTVQENKTVYLYKLMNRSGAYVEVTNFGAIIVRVCVPDKNGELRDVVLGYDEVEKYQKNIPYFGSTIGRSGNRMAGGRFILNGVVYQIPQNENENNLHSGPDGYQLKIWDEKQIDEEKNSIVFERISPDGEQGYPGNFKISVGFMLTEEQELVITYQGVSDADTVANLTNHSYFNLNGAGSGKILDHNLLILADEYTPVEDGKAIPTGEIEKVAGTPMDFTTEKKIGKEIEADFAQLKYTGGYDHNYVLRDYKKGVVRRIAEASSEESGIKMTVYTDLPGVQFYAGNFIGEESGKDHKEYRNRDAFCLETQYAPNAINEVHFVSPLLKANEEYKTQTIYQFSIK